MGFIDSSPEASMPVFYNVVHAVGKQCPNMKDDTKLVQYLLVAFYDGALTVSPIYTRPKGDMTVDGICGPITNNWILKFQLDVNQRYPNTTPADNRVDRIRNKNMIGSISQMGYTLAILNRFTAKVNPDAYVALPKYVQLQNPENVPPPSYDMIGEIIVPETAGY